MKTCSIDGCDRRHEARDWCKLHYDRWYRHGDPRADVPPAGVRGSAHVHWRNGDPGYLTMHKRIHRTRGPASEWQCGACAVPAQQWALMVSDSEDVRVDDENGFSYSIDMDDYLPLCRSCHVTHDRWDNLRGVL